MKRTACSTLILVGRELVVPMPEVWFVSTCNDSSLSCQSAKWRVWAGTFFLFVFFYYKDGLLSYRVSIYRYNVIFR